MSTEDMLTALEAAGYYVSTPINAAGIGGERYWSIAAGQHDINPRQPDIHVQHWGDQATEENTVRLLYLALLGQAPRTEATREIQP